MYGMPMFGGYYGPGYSHLLNYGVGLWPGYVPYCGYGHLQGYGVGLHPDYRLYGAGCGCAQAAGYVRYSQVESTVEKPVRGKG